MREARFIPLTPVQSPPQQSASTVLPLPPALAPRGTDAPTDRLSRPLRDLRISVTDRCNFRCGYCMPRTVYGPGHAFLPHTALLSFEEIERASRLLVGLGIHKIRLTGGEPLLRKQLDRLIATLAPLTTPQGQAVELTLTTNGTLLAAQAAALRSAGLHRVTISLDALDDPVFQRMNDAGVSVARVLDGIEAAHKVGLGPLKVNMVVQRGVNEDQIVPMARHFRHSGVELRYIEYMDVGSTNGWQRSQVLPSEDVLRRLQAHFSLTPLPPGQPGETARRYRHTDGAGQIGLISSVTQAFCGDCNRLRLSTDGRLYTCLFATRGHDLRTALRSGSADDTLTGQLRALWQQREDRYSQMRNETGVSAARPSQAERPIEMSYIGG